MVCSACRGGAIVPACAPNMPRGLFAQAYKMGVNPRRAPADKLTSALLLFIRPAPGDKEFTMTTLSLTFKLATTYAPQAAAKPAPEAARKTLPVPADDSGCEAKRPVARQNPLEQAMLSALRELGFGGTSAVPAAPAASADASAATATAAAAPSLSVESAVHQFAHALFQALRQSDSGKKSSDDDSGRAEGHHRHHHHHRHHEGRRYGDMSQRLEALSQTVGAPTSAAAAASASTPAGAEASAGSSLSVTLQIDDGTTDTAAPASTLATPAVTTTAAPVTKTPLLDAFTKLFNALKPQTTTAAPTTPATDMAEKLRQFLHSLAQAMAPDAMGSVQHAQLGGLVNVTA